MSQGSSPKVSSTRPQRVSRAMHSTGEKVQPIPVAATSRAVARAASRTRSGSQVQAWASWLGKIVAPCQKEWPWMQSSATSNGMPSRVSRARVMQWSMRSWSVCRIEPTGTASSTGSGSEKTGSWVIWPTFSAGVIRPSRSETRWWTGSAGSR